MLMSNTRYERNVYISGRGGETYDVAFFDEGGSLRFLDMDNVKMPVIVQEPQRENSLFESWNQ